MIGAVSGLGSHAAVQWQSYTPSARSNTSTAAEHPSVAAVRKSPGLETPVQPVDAATPVTPEVSGNLNIDLSVRNSVDVTEMAVRMRISPAEADTGIQGVAPQETAAADDVQERPVQRIGTEEEAQEIFPRNDRAEETGAASEETQDAFETKEAERQARLEERALQAEEAETKREAYLESLEEAEQARAERLETLRESQAEDSGEEEGEEAVSSTGEADKADEKNGESRQNGFLELDYTASLLQNYQMNNLLQAQISARMKGEDTTTYDAALDALQKSGQDRVRFVSDSGESGGTARQAYQQPMDNSLLGIVA